MHPSWRRRRSGAASLCKLNLKNDLPECQADSDLIYRALFNILQNGIQAMDRGGTLTVESSLSTDGSSIAVRVSDNGSGMPPEVKEQIFQPFFTEKHRGTGLGLAIVKNIIDGHHGSIEVESYPGEGTIFILKLPIIREGKVASEKALKKTKLKVRGGKAPGAKV